MNKGSWRMLQDTTIYATVHRLSKAKNNKTTDDRQISICEGQVHLAGADTQGQKKAQRCFIILFPASSKSNWIQNALLPICLTCHFPKIEGSFQSQNPRAQLCHPQREIVMPAFPPGAQEEETSCLPLAASAPPYPWHSLHQSRHSMTYTKNFRMYHRNCWLC